MLVTTQLNSENLAQSNISDVASNSYELHLDVKIAILIYFKKVDFFKNMTINEFFMKYY
jgi:hypothetical protein